LWAKSWGLGFWGTSGLGYELGGFFGLVVYGVGNMGNVSGDLEGKGKGIGNGGWRWGRGGLGGEVDAGEWGLGGVVLEGFRTF
jgi:hypothetical protein